MFPVGLVCLSLVPDGLEKKIGLPSREDVLNSSITGFHSNQTLAVPARMAEGKIP